MTTSTPKSCRVAQPSKRSASQDFDEQIKMLELEGNRLLASQYLSHSAKSTPVEISDNDQSFSSPASSFSALVDITEEQKVLDEINSRLEARAREAETLTRHLLDCPHVAEQRSSRPASCLCGGQGFRSSCAPPPSKKPVKSVGGQPSTEGLLDSGSCTGEKRAGGSSAVSQQQDTQEVIANLRTQLKDAADEQKIQYQQTIDDLQKQLKFALATKESLIRTLEKDTAEQDNRFMRLKQSCDQLEQTNRTQQDLIQELTDKLEMQNRERRLVDSYLDQVRGQIMDQERKRGRRFCEELGSVLHQDTAGLVRTIELCLQEMSSEVELKENAHVEKSLAAQRTEQQSSMEKVGLLHEQVKNAAEREAQLSDVIKKQTAHINELQTAIDAAKLETICQTVDENSNQVSRESTLHPSTSSADMSKLTLDLEQARSHHSALEEECTRLKETQKITEDQLRLLSATKDELSVCLSERYNEISRLIQDRDLAAKSSEATLDELASLKEDKDRMTAQLESYKATNTSLKEQLDRLTSQNENRTSDAEWKREKNELERQLTSNAVDLKKSQAEREQLAKKAKGLEKRIASFEKAVWKGSQELEQKNVELQGARSDRAEAGRELEESRQRAEALRGELEKSRATLKQVEANDEKRLGQMADKLKSALHDLRLSKEALDVHGHVDSKAVEVASNMQMEVTQQRNEVDSLCSKVRQHVDALEACRKEKRAFEEGNHLLSERLKDAETQKEKYAEAWRLCEARNSQLQSQLARIEAAYKELSVKHTAAMSQAEQAAQDMVRLKLKHQLELKELERTRQIMRACDNPASTDLIPALSHVDPSLTSYTDFNGLSSRHGTSDYPTSIKPHQDSQSRSNADIGCDLSHLVQEMRALTARSSDSLPVHKSKEEAFASEDIPSVQVLSENALLNSEGNRRGNVHLRHEAPVRDTSIYELMTGFPSEVLSSQRRKPVIVGHRGRGTLLQGSHHLDPDTEALCQRLELKAENLTKLGNGFHKENKEIPQEMTNSKKKLSKMKRPMPKK